MGGDGECGINWWEVEGGGGRWGVMWREVEGGGGGGGGGRLMWREVGEVDVEGGGGRWGEVGERARRREEGITFSLTAEIRTPVAVSLGYILQRCDM